MQFLRSTFILYAAHLRMLSSSVRTLISFLAVCLLVLLAALFAGNEDALIIGTRLGLFGHLMFLVPIIGMMLGSAVVTEELESRTLTYPFTRPISRLAFFLGRWGATITVVGVLCGAGAVGVSLAAEHSTLMGDGGEPMIRLERLDTETGEWKRAAPSRTGAPYWLHHDGDWIEIGVRDMREGDTRDLDLTNSNGEALRLLCRKWDLNSRELPGGFLLRFLWASVLGGVIYSLFTAGLGIYLKNPIILALGYTIAIEWVLSNIPGNAQKISVQYYLRCIVYDPETMNSSLRGAAFTDVTLLTPTGSTIRLFLFILVAVAICGRSIRRKQFTFTS